MRPFPNVNDGRCRGVGKWRHEASVGAKRTRALLCRSGEHAHGGAVQTAGATFATGNPVKLFEMAYAASLTSPRDSMWRRTASGSW